MAHNQQKGRAGNWNHKRGNPVALRILFPKKRRALIPNRTGEKKRTRPENKGKLGHSR